LLEAAVEKSGACVFIVDDDPFMREGIESLVRADGLGVHSFGSAQEFLTYQRPDAPTCLVLDVRMPGLNGLELQQELIKADAPIPIVFITGHGDVSTSVRGMKAGAAEFLTKPFRDQELMAAIRQCLEMDRTAREARAETATLVERYDSLTARERAVLKLVIAGLRNKQIAAELDIKEITVKVHRGQVMQKMAAKSLAELVRVAERLRIGSDSSRTERTD
jgi:FixJ family two-component response regulator